MPETLTLEPWERLPDEPNLWFDRFEQFRLLGPERSLLETVNLRRDRKGAKRTSSIPQAWREACQRWRWWERSEAWDECERLRLRREHEEDRREDRAQRIALLRAHRAALIQALARLSPEEATWSEVSSGIKVVTEQLRKEFGDEPAQRHEHTGTSGGPIRLTVEEMTDEELLVIARSGGGGTAAP